jgi:hypothetical protein
MAVSPRDDLAATAALNGDPLEYTVPSNSSSRGDYGTPVINSHSATTAVASEPAPPEQ